MAAHTKMTSEALPAATDGEVGTRIRQWLAAALLFGLLLVTGWHQGGFWRQDALVIALASVALLAVALTSNPPDRLGVMVVADLLLLALWWFIRAVATGSESAFFPLGASFLAFAAAFAAVRPLEHRAREVAGLGVACLGAAGAVIGFVGLVWRWFPMAMPAQGLWRLSSTLTYSDAAGLVLGVCLFLALGSSVYPAVSRVAVCLCTGGLLASQSRGALIAFVCGCLIVPSSRYVRFLVPLVAGAALGVAAIATSSSSVEVPWLGVTLLVSVTISALATWDVSLQKLGAQTRIVLGLLLLAGSAAVVALVRHELALRTFSPSDQDRSVEWATALHQWRTAPFFGVGPDRLLLFHAIDGTYAYFAHNEYLQVAADTGIVGLVLLALVAVWAARLIRRRDDLTSCATAALVCWAVGGAFDFDWHLTFVGFVGGWCLGLASMPTRDATKHPKRVISWFRPVDPVP